tara:strand:+ start:261 stop:437 length:177 start_codon:yes stop_codon:yes gene_type:complete
MIKKLKKFIAKIFGIIQCKCAEKKDPHLVLYEDVPEPDIPLVNSKLEKINRKHKKGSE